MSNRCHVRARCTGGPPERFRTCSESEQVVSNRSLLRNYIINHVSSRQSMSRIASFKKSRLYGCDNCIALVTLDVRRIIAMNLLHLIAGNTTNTKNFYYRFYGCVCGKIVRRLCQVPLRESAPAACPAGALVRSPKTPGGLHAGSPPFPPPRLIRPTVRRLPRSPRLLGPGPRHAAFCMSAIF